MDTNEFTVAYYLCNTDLESAVRFRDFDVIHNRSRNN
jgi:hypothetical protein